MLLVRDLTEASASWQALLKLSKEIWRASAGEQVLSSTLPKLLSALAVVVASPPRAWSEVRGPMGVASLEAERLVWTLLPKGRLLLEDGETIAKVG